VPKKAIELGPLQVSRLRRPGLHAVGGVAGLQLQVSEGGARSWVLRVMVGAKRRDVGLGGFPDVTLATARDKARDAREKIAAGVDPVLEKQAARSALIASQVGAKTFGECAASYLKARSPEWKSAKHAAQWASTLQTYAAHMTDMQVRDVGLPHVLAALEPIWTEKTETATRVRGRIEEVLDWATTRGYRDGVNPARWKGHLDNLLPKPRKVTKVEHHAALPAADVGTFMVALRRQAGTGARALEFAILCAARSGEVRGATWSEIDLEAAIWTIPGERMKVGKPHRVPLSPAALKLLKATQRMAGNDLVYPAMRGGQLSDMTLSAVLRRMEVPAVPHGFRASFKTWATECTSFPREVIEMALAHTLENKVEAAYQRGDLFEKRRKLMEAWAQFCAKPEGRAKGTVTPIRGKAAA
jgi:integrase